MEYKQTNYKDSFEHLKKCRKNVYPNAGFVKQLLEHEKSIFGENSCTIFDFFPNYDENQIGSRFIGDDFSSLFENKKGFCLLF